MKKTITKNNRGSALLLVLLIIGSVLIIVLTLADLTFSGLRKGGVQNLSNQSYFAADTGMEEAMYKLRKEDMGPDDFPFSGDLESSLYNVRYFIHDDGDYLHAVATTTNVVREIKTGFLEPDYYTLYFEPEGGEVAPTSKSVVRGEPVGALPIPTLDGYTFVEWNSASDGNGEPYTPTTIHNEPGDVTVYAQWGEDAIQRTLFCTSKPQNTAWNTTDEITQTLHGENWAPDNVSEYNAVPSEDECRFKCVTDNYVWNDGLGYCEPGTQSANCTAKPGGANTVYNTVNTISQTWSGTDWLPDETTVYNPVATTTACHFKCVDDFYIWDTVLGECKLDCGLFDVSDFDDSSYCEL